MSSIRRSRSAQRKARQGAGGRDRGRRATIPGAAIGHGMPWIRARGWDGCFEAFLAEIAAKFVREFDPGRERCGIAEKDGENVGVAFVVRQSARVAMLAR